MILSAYRKHIHTSCKSTLLLWDHSSYCSGFKATRTEHSVCVTYWCIWILASSNRYVRGCLHVCTWLLVGECVCFRVCVFAFVFQEERVVPDRAESSQPISQHRCDIDLSAHRRWGGGMRGGRWEGEGWGRREARRGRRFGGVREFKRGDGGEAGVRGEQRRWVSSTWRCVSMLIVRAVIVFFEVGVPRLCQTRIWRPMEPIWTYWLSARGP